MNLYITVLHLFRYIDHFSESCRQTCVLPFPTPLFLIAFSNSRGFCAFLLLIKILFYFLYSGSAMNVAYGPVELKTFLEEAARVSQVS